ncbi:hypothetical protein J1N35_002128 [Gossypium stocksii]|uniref:Reverse transcriptase n=1 Tax=Gossypium stocksii TaxID=47602 RepID=A0A9D3WK02_9ROSI|nr:hypothetical protein J1N35_002128 [Gossypium stocksii]
MGLWTYWHIIGQDTCNFYLDILNNSKSLEDINGTQLVLIPKIANPLNLKNFRLLTFAREGLSALMRIASQERKILGAKVCRSSSPITHLIFVDDCILFGEVSDRGINVFKGILREYESCSGQCVNFKKSTVFFSSKVNIQDKNLIFRVLNVRCSTEPEKYLGLPNMVGQRKRMAFQTLKDILKQNINSWSVRYLSQYSKEKTIGVRILSKVLEWSGDEGAFVQGVASDGLRVKINFDATFNKQRNESCSGLVVRNGRAEVICSKTVMHENIPSAFVAEAMACLQMHLGLFLGLKAVEIE